LWGRRLDICARARIQGSGRGQRSSSLLEIAIRWFALDAPIAPIIMWMGNRVNKPVSRSAMITMAWACRPVSDSAAEKIRCAADDPSGGVRKSRSARLPQSTRLPQGLQIGLVIIAGTYLIVRTVAVGLSYRYGRRHHGRFARGDAIVDGIADPVAVRVGTKERHLIDASRRSRIDATTFQPGDLHHNAAIEICPAISPAHPREPVPTTAIGILPSSFCVRNTVNLIASQNPNTRRRA